MLRDLLMFVLAIAFAVSKVHAQIADDYILPRPSNCCLLNTATTLAEQLQDWNQISRYHEANHELMRRPVETGRVVFLGEA